MLHFGGSAAIHFPLAIRLGAAVQELAVLVRTLPSYRFTLFIVLFHFIPRPALWLPFAEPLCPMPIMIMSR